MQMFLCRNVKSALPYQEYLTHPQKCLKLPRCGLVRGKNVLDRSYIYVSRYINALTSYQSTLSKVCNFNLVVLLLMYVDLCWSFYFVYFKI